MPVTQKLCCCKWRQTLFCSGVIEGSRDVFCSDIGQDKGLTAAPYAGASTSYLPSPAPRQSRASAAILSPVRRPHPPTMTLQASTPEPNTLAPSAASETRQPQDELRLPSIYVLPPGRRYPNAYAERRTYPEAAGVSGKLIAREDAGLAGKQRHGILAERSSRHPPPRAASSLESTAEEDWSLREAVAEPDHGRQPRGGSFVERSWANRQQRGRSSSIAVSDAQPELRLTGPTDEASWLEGEGSSCSPGPVASGSSLGWDLRAVLPERA